MFNVDNSGNLVYNEDIIDNGSLFGDATDSSTAQQEDQEFLDSLNNDVQIMAAAAEPAVEVSSGDAASPDQNITYYTVYAVPSSATGFPNSSSVAYLEDVVKGYPLDYDYVAYRTDDNYSQAMILFIGPRSTVSGSTVTIEDCDVIELQYNTGSGYNSFITRNMYHEDIAEINLVNSTLAYTNTVPGYATFDTTMQHKANNGIFSFILIGIIAFLIIQRLIGGYRHD